MMPGTLVSIYIWNAILHYDRCDVIMDDIIKQQWCTIMWQLWFHDGIIGIYWFISYIYCTILKLDTKSQWIPNDK